MKRELLILLITAFCTTSCNDIIEKQLEIYEEATEKLDNIDDFHSLINEALDTETEIAQIMAKTTEEELKELKENYAEIYEAMTDSIEKMRNSYYSYVDKLFLKYTYNFVERRTLLYQMAADRYCQTEYIEELNAIKEIIKRYSHLSFVESQRACDPPSKIREEYETAKEIAENCFDVAKKRILNEEEK